ncbi:hypothetical protein DCAR_0311260 [Daucus carota subsp. sativus]|uniref:Uncharacterized protein n=1 Tax=Daucus carota subsp. sativus TaxID=79200 RepID=A0A166AGJ9_DAUCS|nr:hypothetical protein DCAR_0311260 [Daucus carota subsp. sativus]
MAGINSSDYKSIGGKRTIAPCSFDRPTVSKVACSAGFASCSSKLLLCCGRPRAHNSSPTSQLVSQYFYLFYRRPFLSHNKTKKDFINLIVEEIIKLF